ncbi:uncharacterized protein LOC127869482 isoform X1 [Dreissena polymorpha]|uniref:uncharacterized protein LOC127869482 isoform X1 n=1 Tax=Dreissena polymorpha TaxID=45954 RepID=UPI002263B6C0|nr:uncharacterized protein LOC127869482 isoform X1 [Dreissena polymorpha]
MLTLTTYVASFVLCYYVSSVSAFCESVDLQPCPCGPIVDTHTFCFICPCHIRTSNPVTHPRSTTTSAPVTTPIAIASTTLNEFGCPAFPSDCPSSCSDLDANFCPICNCAAGSVTTTPKPTGCPQVQCLLDCGDPPKFVKDSQGCDLCQCDFGR